MILIDSSIPMYLVGATHRHKNDAQRMLEQLVSQRQRLVTDAEVLQDPELLLELSSEFAKVLSCNSIGELARQPAAPGELFSKDLYFAIPVHIHETTEQQKR